MLCKHYGKCGGCQIQHLNYDEQIDMKVKKLIDIFGFEPEEIIKSPKIFFYRNRMDWVIGPNYEVGLKERGKWWKYVNIDECLLQSNESNIIRNEFREFIKEKNLEPWDTRNHKGFIRYIVVREGKFTGERMINIITYESKEEERIREIFLEFYDRIEDYVTSFYWGINPKITDISYGFEEILLNGNKYLKEKLKDNVYYISPNSFFQSNSYTAEIMLNKVIEYLEPKENEIIYDLYSGIGTFSIEIAKYSKKVIGVEYEKEAKDMFYINSKENDIKNAEFILSKVEDLGEIKADKILLDPPRSGIHKKVVKLIGNSNANRIVYVSCNPETQHRDIKELERFGYKLEKYIFVDQFPHTYHIETIALIKRF